ncbi:GNAT family acetyltransferase [Actinoplanes sp. NBRC 103695]|nr:GNAT family acetyltransferase [Actinoplanes sp. NBRC 103695]
MRMGVLLETERLRLREFEAGDVAALVDLDSDPEVMFHLNGGRATGEREIEDDVLPYMLSWYSRPGGFGYWAVEERATGAFVGWFHLRPGRRRAASDGAEIGYRFRRDVWGKGYATEGTRALIAKAFTDLGVKRVFAETMAVHTASRRVMEKAGLRYLRTFHADWPDKIPGDELGDVEYALTLDEWRNAI